MIEIKIHLLLKRNIYTCIYDQIIYTIDYNLIFQYIYIGIQIIKRVYGV